MKLSHLVIWKMTLAFSVVLTLWAGLFYMAVMEEVNDEVDDSLEDYSERLIIRALSGEEMPASNNGSNNQYYLYQVSPEYARAHAPISYRDEMVYIAEKDETEPARVLITIFRTGENHYMELVVYIPTIEKYDLQRAILGWIVFLYVLLLMAMALITAWVYRRNMKPLYVLLEWLDNYKLGRAEPLDNETKVTEFKRLNDAALAAAARNEQLYEQQKLFIGNASHEMQTPLAICRNRLEMLMDDETLSERQLEELLKTYRTLEGLTRLNKSLLLLCKIENGQYMDVSRICLDELIEQYLDDYKEVYAYRELSVTFRVESHFYAEINESLAVILVTNLLKNAFVHTAAQGGCILIEVSEQSLSVANSGQHPLDGKRVFERFYQGEKKEGSTGLGLALADTICKTSQLLIGYRFDRMMHRFIITRAEQEAHK